YWPPVAGPRHSHRTAPNASAAANHRPLSTAAARRLFSGPLVRTRSITMSTARTARVTPHAHRGTAVIVWHVQPAAAAFSRPARLRRAAGPEGHQGHAGHAGRQTRRRGPR